MEFREIQSMSFAKIEKIDLVDREVLRNLKKESEDHLLAVDSVAGQDCSSSKKPQKLSTVDDQFTERDCTRNENESQNSKNVEEDTYQLTEKLHGVVDGEAETIQLSTEISATEADSNEEEEQWNDSKDEKEKSGPTQMLCDFDCVVKIMEEKASEVKDDNLKISEKEEARHDVTNSDSEVEESASRTETQDSDLLIDKKMNGESEDCNTSKGTANNVEENENEQLLEKTRKRKTDFSDESEDFNENPKMKITEIEISPNSIDTISELVAAETGENIANFTPEATNFQLYMLKKEESEFNFGIVDLEIKKTEAKSTSTEAIKADTEEGEYSRDLKDEEKPTIINEKAVKSIFAKQETFEKLQKCDHLQEDEDNNNCKIHNNIVGEEATKIDKSVCEESQDPNNTHKDEGDKEDLKKKCDDPEEAEPSAKIAKTEHEPVEVEHVECDPVECELLECEPVQPDLIECETVECEPIQPEPIECEPVEGEPVEDEPGEGGLVEPEPENPDETANKSEVNTDLIQQIFQNPMTYAWESKDEGNKGILKRKCDDPEEAEPNAKIAKIEPGTVESGTVEPELAEPEPEPENPDETAKKSEVNTDLIQQILQHPMTSAWESKLHKPYELHTLDSDTEEYKTVKAKFDATSANRLTAKEIKRVENPYLLGIYLLKKDKLERNSNRSVEERCLFHGTRESSVDGICRFNFDWRRKGQSRGHKFGQGVSFSPKSSYSRHYGGGSVMFLAKVLVSQAVEGDCDTVVPPEPYDSTRNHSGDVIVKYSDDDFYPQYIIYYTGCSSF